MGLKESLKKLQENELKYGKVSLKREVKKELTKIKNIKVLDKKCIMCDEKAKYAIKGSNEWYCKHCAIEYFGDLTSLTKIQEKSKTKNKSDSRKIYVITGNNKKFEEINSIIPFTEQLNIDLIEIQEVNPAKIIEAKILEARKHFKGEFIVEDTSLSIDCLNGLPGPLIKWFLEKLGVDGIYNITIKLHDPQNINQGIIGKATARTMIGYSDKKGKIMIFEGTLEGSIIKPKVKTDFGWDPIFKPKGYDKSFGEMTREEKNLISMRRIALEKLKIYLKIQNFKR